MIATKIPFEFIRPRVRLLWADIAYGLEHQLIAPNVAIEKAKERMSESDSASAQEIELAGLSPNESIAYLLRQLVSGERAPSSESVRAKWLYLVLAWLLASRDSVTDPLALVEEIYTAFDYPREMEPFVRYMPMIGPDLGSRQANEERMYLRWKEYIDVASKRYSQTSEVQ